MPIEATLGGSASTRATLLAAALGLVGACTTITEFPAAGSTGDVVDGSTTTTGLLPTGVDPTAAGSSGASSSSDSMLDTSTSDPTNGDFVGPGPDVPAVELCDVWDDDCPRGEKCTFWANDGGGLPNSTRCVPLDPSPAGPGEPCRAESLGFDDCDVGSMCWDVDRTGHGACIPFCTGSPEEPTCDDPERFCSIGGGPLSLCRLQCDPLDPGACERGHGCYLGSDELLICVPDVSGDEGALFEACEFANACDPGLTCAAEGDVGACDPLTSHCCTPYCALASSTCPKGTQCVPLFDQDHPVPSQTDLGFCGQVAD